MNVSGKGHVLRKFMSVMLAFAMVLGSMAGGSLQATWAEVEHEHSYNEKGFCTGEGCEDPYQMPAAGDGSSSNPYQINNAGQLYYFAKLLKTSNSYMDTCAKLMDDIVINDGEVTGVDGNLRTWDTLCRTTITAEHLMEIITS